jgi:hypothetical protein
MTRRSWALGAILALAWGCDGTVIVGNLPSDPAAGSTDGSAVKTPDSSVDGGMGGPQDPQRGSDSGQGAPGGGPNATTYTEWVFGRPPQSTCGLTDGQAPEAGSTCLCFPQALPTDATGQAPCQLFFELGAKDTCEAHSLLSVAPDVAASLGWWQGSAPPGPICVVPQLPSAQWVNGACSGSSKVGWCYVTGAAAGNCEQTVIVSTPTLLPAGAVANIGCGETPATGAPPATSATLVGARCIPSPELSSTFWGFDYHEVTLDENNPACSGDVCLLNHFQGLTSCPYGQGQGGQPTAQDASACTVPGTGAPVRPNTLPPSLPPPSAEVSQFVSPWCADRKASDTVYCSCRCANAEGNTNDGASYCACPTGYTCAQVVPAFMSGDPRAGGYCIKAGTAYDANSVCNVQCDPTANPCP